MDKVMRLSQFISANVVVSFFIAGKKESLRKG